MGVKKIAVLGGGIIGISSALRIIQSVEGIQVTILSEKFSPDTTGDGSAGFLMPYSLSSESNTGTIRKWFQETFDYLQELALSEDADLLGVGFLQSYWIGKDDALVSKFGLAEYGDVLLNCHALQAKELKLFPQEFQKGYCGTSLYAECKKLLPNLMKRFKDLGGTVHTRKLSRLEELIGAFDLVVNCTGIGSHTLVPDSSIYPVRGQIIRVRAPWIKHAIFTEEHYIIPNSDVVTLGGTKQQDNWSTEVDAQDKENIWAECCRLLPSTKNAEIIDDFVGLRPTRNSPRLERTMIEDNDRGLTVIHNYGHGGAGVSLFWGCANDVLNLVREAMNEP